MKKRLFSFAMALLAAAGMQAQMIAYSVQTNVVGEPGTPTVIDLQGNTGADLKGLMIDADGNMEFNTVEDAKGFPIGFDFRYNSQKMKYFLIGTDLEIQLSPTETISTEAHLKRMEWFVTEGIHDVIGMAPREGVWGLDDTQISYWTEGTEGYRALVIEYKNIDFGNGGGWGTEGDVCGAKATIQYRLYEQSGNIEMKVKGMKPADPSNYNFFRIGIVGDSKDFVQVQSWDGSVVSAKDNSISYNKEEYPVDGQVYTFVAPEPCVTPAVAPTDLLLTSTTTQICGTFTATQGDHFLVLATTEESLSEMPAAGTKYAVGDVIGNAQVIANVDRTEFAGADNMEQGNYNVFVIAYNKLCMDGPLYCAETAKAAIAMKPGAPQSITISNIEKTSLSVAAVSSGAQIVIAMTDQPAYSEYDELLASGQFGEPTGSYNVGDEIQGGGKVIYIGATTETPVALTELASGKPYFFRAWSTDGQGGYSSEYVEYIAATAAELPWAFDMQTAPLDSAPYGWTQSDDFDWALDPYNNYFYTNAPESWRETPYICLNEGSNWLKVQIATTQGGGWMSSNWEMEEGEEITFQVTTDGVEYQTIFTINKENMPTWTKNEFYTFNHNFTEGAGQKVKVRMNVKRNNGGQVMFKNMALEGTLYGIVGNIPGLDWDNDLLMTQDAENKNIYTTSLDVTIDEVPAEAYEYKLRANQNWEGYQIPAEGNQSWMPAETGDYRLVFTADIASNSLSLNVERPFSVSFDNKGNWSTVYAYTFTYDPLTETVTEFSGAWPGTLVEVSGGFFNRSWTYNFTAEHQPQYIIWNNGGGSEWEEAEQTGDLPFVNGKKYSYFPEITSVKISGSWNEWNGPEMELINNNYAYLTTVDLTKATENQEFKLVVNGEWIGSGELEAIEGDAAGSVTEGETGSNLKLAAGKGYDIVAFWSTPGNNVKQGWLIEVTENTTVGVDGVRANAAQKQTIHNLKGQRLQQQQRGVNIVNGKKIAVK